MTIDLFITMVGIGLMLATGQRVGRPGTEFTPIVGLFSLGLFLTIGGFILCVTLYT